MTALHETWIPGEAPVSAQSWVASGPHTALTMSATLRRRSSTYRQRTVRQSKVPAYEVGTDTRCLLSVWLPNRHNHKPEPP